jgi:hypothetical protein
MKIVNLIISHIYKLYDFLVNNNKKKFTRYARRGKEKKEQSAKAQECKELKSPRRTKTDNAKTEIVEPVIAVGVDAVGRTAVPRIAAPRTTAQHFSITALTSLVTIFARRTYIPIAPIILTPFPHITVHIIQTKAIRRKTTHICCLLTKFTFWLGSISHSAVIIS